MRIWFDTEFIEDGRTIDLISIGMVREDGAELYAEMTGVDFSLASDWVRANVLPHLDGRPIGMGGPMMSRYQAAERIRSFAGSDPEFWAYFADYDWVALCQLYGRMIDLPAGWPMYCRDLKQLADEMGVERGDYPADPELEHHALADARWNREVYAWLDLFAVDIADGL